jgi:glycosyltransferase involved in cell wall biosynthesis
MLVSVCMIVRNEEDNLAHAISSIPTAYEIVIVDTGSTDKTVEIALSLGVKVTHFPWIDDFSAARNKSVSLAQGDYILMLDADEQLSGDVEQKINDFVLHYPHSAGTVTIYNIIDQSEINTHRMVRFFPNHPNFYFQGKVHEKVAFRGQPAEFEDTGVEVRHTGYQKDLYIQKGKTQRYLNLYKVHLETYPNDGYMLYQLGKLYYSTDDLMNAKETLLHCLRIKEENNLYFPVMLVILGYTLKGLGLYQDAETLLMSYKSQYRSFPDLPFLLGLLAMDTGNINQIETNFLQALQIGETNKYSTVTGVGSFKAAYNLGVYNEVIGNLNKALEYYQQSAQKNYKPAIERLKKINI